MASHKPDRWRRRKFRGRSCLADPAVPPHVAVWRSVRAHGDTKTEKSRRTLALPERAVEALREHRRQQAEQEASRISGAGKAAEGGEARLEAPATGGMGDAAAGDCPTGEPYGP